MNKNKFDFKFSEGDVIVYKETGEEFYVVGIERVWIYGKEIDIWGFDYLLFDKHYRLFSYHYDFVEKAFDYRKEIVAVEKDTYDFDFITTLIEYSM